MIHEKIVERKSKWEAYEEPKVLHFGHRTLTLADVCSAGPFILHVYVNESWGDSNNQPKVLNQFVLE